MVECEYSKFTSYRFAYIVLIDTWWNVNPLPVGVFIKEVIVLIDTWWNVNIENFQLQFLSARFNRYMVECEYRIIGKKDEIVFVLIDTWWNVNNRYFLTQVISKKF